MPPRSFPSSAPSAAALLVLFGYLLHVNKATALVCLAAGLALISTWIWKTPLERSTRVLGFKRPPARVMTAGLALGLATAAYARWAQGRPLFPCPLRAFLFISISIGATEELVFRGFFLGRFLDRWRPVAAVAAAALAHAAYKTAIFVPSTALAELALLGGLTFAFGLLLGWWRARNHGVWPCVAFHVVFDFWVYADRTTPWWVW